MAFAITFAIGSVFAIAFGLTFAIAFAFASSFVVAFAIPFAIGIVRVIGIDWAPPVHNRPIFACFAAPIGAPPAPIGVQLDKNHLSPPVSNLLPVLVVPDLPHGKAAPGELAQD
jgi:hypothetical protein